MKTKKVKIGVIGVDSGQVVVCDPCYIDSQWTREEFAPTEYANVRMDADEVVKVCIRKRGLVLLRWDTPLPSCGNKSLNDLARENRVTLVSDANDETGAFSYDGACRASNSEARGGQLNFLAGHPGAGVAVSAGYGDGEYPVFVTYKDGRVKSLEVRFF